MDRQIDADRAWQIPLKVAEELGFKSFDAFLSKCKEYYIDLFNTKKYHRFNQTMGKYFYDAIELIHNKYNDDASNIWKKCMYRLGLVPERKEHDFLNISETEIIYAGKAINPSFPGLMDLAFYYMGSKGYCENNSCDKENCLFGKICKRQGLLK